MNDITQFIGDTRTMGGFPGMGGTGTMGGFPGMGGAGTMEDFQAWEA